jgi:hypothetical protein
VAKTAGDDDGGFEERKGDDDEATVITPEQLVRFWWLYALWHLLIGIPAEASVCLDQCEEALIHADDTEDRSLKVELPHCPRNPVISFASISAKRKEVEDYLDLNKIRKRVETLREAMKIGEDKCTKLFIGFHRFIRRDFLHCEGAERVRRTQELLCNFIINEGKHGQELSIHKPA